jgi:uncharacterized membrane protein YfcA
MMPFILATLIGLAAGVLGGLAGVGGSMVMLPGLAFAFGYDDAAHTSHHVYMAAAMAVNAAVAVPATLRHARHRAVRRELVAWIVPWMIVGIAVGVMLSNRVNGNLLKQGLAVFIAAYCALNVYRVIRPRADGEHPPERTRRLLLGGIGASGGVVAGLLGLGGGVLLVPMLQLLARVRLRHAIATSSAAMAASAAIGAAIKFASLPSLGRNPLDAAWFAVVMAPGAMIGAVIGATLTHRLPVRIVRVAVSILLLIAAARMMSA